MNRSTWGTLKDRLDPELETETPTGALDEAELRIVYALFQLLTDDPDAPTALCRRLVERRTTRERGYLKAYRDGLALLEAATKRLFPGRAFEALSLGERDAVLSRVLWPYPHEEQQPAWRRRLRLTGEHLDILLAPRAARRFRRFVVRDLLREYYTSAAGWSVVGYDEFPGRVRGEGELVDVKAFRVEGRDVLLELSDGTIERLDPAHLRMDDEFGLVVTTKSGRQQAVFSRKAYHDFCQYLEETEDGFLVRIGAVELRVAANEV